MSTKTKSARSVKPSTFRITFTIGEDDYHVIPLRPHPEVAAKAFRFRKQGGTFGLVAWVHEPAASGTPNIAWRSGP
jgi:hypothetical protein